MDHATADDLDFRQVYYDFYLSARSSVFAQEKTNTQTHTKEPNPNWDAYFKLLHDSKGSESIKEIVSTLQKNLSSKSLEFSFPRNFCTPRIRITLFTIQRLEHT